jgi:hypothetical protein
VPVGPGGDLDQPRDSQHERERGVALEGRSDAIGDGGECGHRAKLTVDRGALVVLADDWRLLLADETRRTADRADEATFGGTADDGARLG